MLSNNQIKKLKSLHTKKFRIQHKQFIIEGYRLIKEALNAKIKFDGIWCSDEFANKNQELINSLKVTNNSWEITSTKSLSQVCDSMNNQGIVASIKLPKKKKFNSTNSSILILDNISDPGNMGTILRSAEWFGIRDIILSSACVDPYNSKVIRSAMGAHFYMNQICQNNDIKKLITKLQEDGIDIIGADLNGTSINKFIPPQKWALVLGSEAFGISNEVKTLLNASITIPNKGNIESLNVSIATGIILNHLT